MAYVLKNDLRSIDFHDSCLTNAVFRGGCITLTFRSAVVIGHSCPELKTRIPCPLNRGEDRYAAPELVLRLEGVKELSVLKGGCWRGEVQVYPPRKLEAEELPGFFADIPKGGAGNHVNGVTVDKDGLLTLGFWLDAQMNYFELTCVPRFITAEWDSYGKVAWYVEHHRKKYPVRPVFGAIDWESLRGYTLLRDLLPALEQTMERYNWLITDCYCNKDNPIWDAEDRDGYCWLTGQELVEFAKTDNTQFIGGVFSGFPKEIPLERILEEPLPVWEQPGFWYEPLNLQHPLAQVEVVPWDSTYVLVLSRDLADVDRFRAHFPKSQDLRDHIRAYEEGST